MQEASPARLYAALVGAILVVAGIGGFFASSAFGSPGETHDFLGVFTVNGWGNVLYIVAGALGLVMMGSAARAYAGGIGAFFVAIAGWGFAIGSGDSLLGVVPVNHADNLLHLVLGGLGVAAFLTTRR